MNPEVIYIRLHSSCPITHSNMPVIARQLFTVKGEKSFQSPVFRTKNLVQKIVVNNFLFGLRDIPFNWPFCSTDSPSDIEGATEMSREIK